MSLFIPLRYCFESAKCIMAGKCMNDCEARGPLTKTRYRIDGVPVEEEEAREKIVKALEPLEKEERKNVIEEVQRQIEQQKKELMRLSSYCELLACGMRIDGDEQERAKAQTIMLRAFDSAVKTMPRTPSERLRTMLKHGKNVIKLLDRDQPISFEKFLDLVKASHDYATPEDMKKMKQAGESAFETYVRRLYSCALWAGYGGNQFCLSPNLAAALMLTEVPAVDPEEMKLPYRAFAISLPPGVVPFFVPDAAGSRQQWADTLWIEHDAVKIMWVVRWGTIEVHRYSDHAFTWTEADARDEGLAPEDEIALDAAFRLVRNFLLWLNAEGGIKAQKPVVVPPKLAAKRKHGGEEWPRQWEFGKTVMLRPELRRMASEIALGRSARHAVPGWKLRARFTVRGHWRMQAHGAGRALRMRKWIAPFWKGPAEKEAWAHVYKDVPMREDHKSGEK